MERVGRVAAVRGRIGERAGDLENSTIEPGHPCVMISGVASGSGERMCAKWMSRPVDLGRELRPLVQPRLGGPPVVFVPPVPCQLPQVAARNAVRPSDPGQLVRPPGPVKPLVQIVQIGLRDVDREFIDGLCGTHADEC